MPRLQHQGPSQDQPIRKRQNKKTLTSKKKEKEIIQYTQDFIPIKDIRNGILELTDGRYIKIVEVEPINFSLRSAAEQNTIIYNFAAWLKICNIKVQFKTITKKADAEKHIESLNLDMKGETNENTKKMTKEYIKLVKALGSTNALTRRFFVIFEYEPNSRNKNYNEYTVIYNSLNNAVMQLKRHLKMCGNSIIEPKNEDQHLGEILYIFFNRRSSMEEPFQSRVQRVIEDTMKSRNRVLGRDEIPAIPAINYIAPRGVDLEHPTYLIMDGLYYTFLYLDGDKGYPLVTNGGWMNGLINLGEGIDIDMHFHKQDRVSMTEKIALKIRLNRVKKKDTFDTSRDYEELRDAITSAEYLKEGISQNNEIFYVSTIITITAPTLELLNEKKDDIVNLLKANDMQTKNCNFRQEQALLSVMPINKLDKKIYEKSKRNVLSRDAASSYIFTTFEMCDDNGILLGVNGANNSLCIIDIFNSKVYKNANMCILGTSGAGKTFTEQLMALRMRMRGIQVFIIAPLKGHEFKRACSKIGGTYIKISPGSHHSINVMDIRIPDKTSASILEEDSEIDSESLLSKKLQQFSIFFNLLMPQMTELEKQLLQKALVETYARKGITEDNESLYIPGTNQLREMPILGNLQEVLKENTQTENLAIMLEVFVSGAAKSFNRRTNVDLENKYIVMDISELKDDLLPIGMFIALDYVWDKTKEDVTKKKAIFIDETWLLIGTNPFAANYVLEIFKIIRGYGGAAIAATQDLGDFFALEDGKYGKGIVNNSKIKIILNLEYDEAKFVKDVLKLSKAEVRAITQFERGNALIAANNNKTQVQIIASDMEKSLITTDRKELEEQKQKKLREQEKKRKQEEDRKLMASK